MASNAEKYAHCGQILRLWITNTRGEIENPRYRKRHAHEPDYLDRRASEISAMEWLAAQAERAAKERKDEVA